MHTPEIPPWLRKILDESQDPGACMKAIQREVMPLWRQAHAARPRNPPGPLTLNLSTVGNAVETVLKGLTQADRKTITWKRFLADVQEAVGDSPNKGGNGEPRFYHETVLRPLIWTYILGVLEWEVIPPQFFDRRQPWMPTDKSLPAIKKAFRRERNRPLYRVLRGLKESLGTLEVVWVSFSPKKWKNDRGEVTIIIPLVSSAKWPIFSHDGHALHQK